MFAKKSIAEKAYFTSHKNECLDLYDRFSNRKHIDGNADFTHSYDKPKAKEEISKNGSYFKILIRKRFPGNIFPG